MFIDEGGCGFHIFLLLLNNIYLKMKTKIIYILFLSFVLCGVLDACSSGRRVPTMPKHRKRKKCDCPTFSQFTVPVETIVYGA